MSVPIMPHLYTWFEEDSEDESQRVPRRKMAPSGPPCSQQLSVQTKVNSRTMEEYEADLIKRHKKMNYLKQTKKLSFIKYILERNKITMFCSFLK